MVQWGPKSVSQEPSLDGKCPLSVLNCGGGGTLTCRHEGKGEEVFLLCLHGEHKHYRLHVWPALKVIR